MHLAQAESPLLCAVPMQHLHFNYTFLPQKKQHVLASA